MKLLLTAIALTIAVPAAAQNGAADPHAGHAEYMAQGKSGHDTPETHGEDHRGHAPAHHGKDDKKAGCCQADGRKMPCCEHMAAADKKMDCCAKPGAASAADAHADH